MELVKIIKELKELQKKSTHKAEKSLLRDYIKTLEDRLDGYAQEIWEDRMATKHEVDKDEYKNNVEM